MPFVAPVTTLRSWRIPGNVFYNPLRLCRCLRSGGAGLCMTAVGPAGVDATVRRQTAGGVRVRFAPSPTGNLHVGGARTALYNWLVARKDGGRFIIRVEDTDQERSSRESEERMLADLSWLGLQWDEGPGIGEKGPYRQSERGELYREYAERLLQVGRAYRCFCTEEELEAKRRVAEEEGRPPQYDGTWRDRKQEEIDEMLKAGKSYTVRFRVEEGERVVIQDKIRGEVAWDANATVGDFILLRSNGVPVYNFCVAVDDALMGITTVIRAEEHLTNTLRQVLILRALGFSPPEYAHCSLILGKDRSKLSKRHGATSISQFREQGYLPEAMLNYLAGLGWSDGTDKEIFTVDELLSSFDVGRITKSPAIFDEVKLRWVNSQHLRKLPLPQLAELCVSQLTSSGALDPSVTPTSLLGTTATELVQESIELLTDTEEAFQKALTYPLGETLSTPKAQELLNEGGFKELAGAAILSWENGELPDGSAGEEHMKEWKKWIKALGKAHKKRGRALFHPIRLALTGKMSGPDVGQVLLLLRLAEKTSKNVVTLDERMRILKKTLETL